MLSFLANASTYSLVTLGCKVNRVESDTLKVTLNNLGLCNTTHDKADVVFINTCTVTADADKKARKAIRSALKLSPKALIVATGCATEVNPNMFTSISERVCVIGRIELFSELNNLLPKGKSLLRTGEGFRTRVGIKVQDGCNNACTYCIVHNARGPARSMPHEDIFAEAECYFQAGTKELVLTGIDLGSYNDGEFDIATLVGELLLRARSLSTKGEQPARIRLSSIEPLSVSKDLIDLLAKSNGQLCRHLHLPLQSGSSKVLAEMARPYSAEAFMELVNELYNAVPELSLTTDIICGFPGETEEDFKETLTIARHARFSKIHVFPYSRREGTPAAGRPDQIPPEVISKRTSTLRKLAQDLRAADRAFRSGNSELVLKQGKTSLTESYHEIESNSEDALGSLTLRTLPW